MYFGYAQKCRRNPQIKVFKSICCYINIQTVETAAFNATSRTSLAFIAQKYVEMLTVETNYKAPCWGQAVGGCDDIRSYPRIYSYVIGQGSLKKPTHRYQTRRAVCKCRFKKYFCVHQKYIYINFSVFYDFFLHFYTTITIFVCTEKHFCVILRLICSVRRIVLLVWLYFPKCPTVPFTL